MGTGGGGGDQRVKESEWKKRRRGGDQHVKKFEWKMRRTGGGRQGKESEWAMGRTRRGGSLTGALCTRFTLVLLVY
jgi:hypothetical protein